MMSTRLALAATVAAVASLHMGCPLPAGVRAAQLRGSEDSGATMAPVPEVENAVAQGSLSLGNKGTREERTKKIQLVADAATASERRMLLERLRLPDRGEEEKQKKRDAEQKKREAEQAAEAELPDKNTVRVMMPDGISLNLTFEADRVTPQMVREGIVGKTGDSSHRHALFLPGGEEELAPGDELVFEEGRAELFAMAQDLGLVWDEFVSKASVPGNYMDATEQAAPRLLALWREAAGWEAASHWSLDDCVGNFKWARRWVENARGRELDDHELKFLISIASFLIDDHEL